jgi:uncharacterized protein (AIM24 family)
VNGTRGRVPFTHEGSGGVGEFLEEVLTHEDLPLVRVSGEGEVFFAHEAAFVDLTGGGASIDGTDLPAFDAAVGRSANLVPQVVSSTDVRSVLRGGSGEAFQCAFHGPGSVVVQPSELSGRTQQSPSAAQTGGGFLGDLLR